MVQSGDSFSARRRDLESHVSPRLELVWSNSVMTNASAARSLVLEKDLPAKTVLGRSVTLSGERIRA